MIQHSIGFSADEVQSCLLAVLAVLFAAPVVYPFSMNLFAVSIIGPVLRSELRAEHFVRFAKFLQIGDRLAPSKSVLFATVLE